MLRMFPRSLFVLLALGGLVAACGCGRQSKVSGSKYMGLGDDAISHGKIRTAIVCFEKEIELNPKNPAPHLRLALIYEHLRRDPAKAKDYYEQYFARETNETKRKLVEQWRREPDDEAPVVEPAGQGEQGSNDTALAAELQETRRKLREALDSNEEFASRIIELEGVERDLASNRAALDGLTKERDDLKKQAQTQGDSLASLTKAFDELKAKYDAATQGASNTLAQLQQRVADLEARNAQLEEEQSRAGRRSLSKRLEEARAALKAAEDKSDQYAAEIEQLHKRIAELEAAQDSSTGRRTVTHVVQEGETLTAISLKYYGTKDRWKEIYEANRSTIPDPNHIKAGQKLIVPLDNSQ
jgi:nucleoid-associated protein YgaU